MAYKEHLCWMPPEWQINISWSLWLSIVTSQSSPEFSDEDLEYSLAIHGYPPETLNLKARGRNQRYYPLRSLARYPAWGIDTDDWYRRYESYEVEHTVSTITDLDLFESGVFPKVLIPEGIRDLIPPKEEKVSFTLSEAESDADAEHPRMFVQRTYIQFGDFPMERTEPAVSDPAVTPRPIQERVKEYVSQPGTYLTQKASHAPRVSATWVGVPYHESIFTPSVKWSSPPIMQYCKIGKTAERLPYAVAAPGNRPTPIGVG